VPLVERLGPLHTAIQFWCIVLGEANESLNCKEDIGDETQDGVGRLEMCAIVRELVDLDYDEPGNKEVEAEVIE